MRVELCALFLVSLAACAGGNDQRNDGAGAGAGAGSGSPSGSMPRTEKKAVRDCSDRTLIAGGNLEHDLATDATNYYWLDVSDVGIAVFKKAKAGGDPAIVSEFPDAFAFLFDKTDLPVSEDSQLLMDDTVADDADEYIYFSGDTQIWRVKKDGSEPVQPVSGAGLSELGPATCNFARSVLTTDSLYSCRQGRLFRMDRAGNGKADLIYAAPEGTSIDAFAVSSTGLFVNGPFDDTRHLAPILTLPLTGGTPSEYGAMLEGLVPDALVMVGDTLLFNSLTVLKAPDFATTSEWATRQGTYKLTAPSAAPVKISETHLALVYGVEADAQHAYAVLGDQVIERISPDGVTTTYVDCTDSPDNVRIKELLVDADGVYIRTYDGFYRFEK